jgi:hypothetical protein
MPQDERASRGGDRGPAAGRRGSQGRCSWYASSPSARRGFCPICGSNLFWDGPGAHLSIFAGTLDGDPGIRLAGHIHCADKGAYYDIADGLPQVPGADPGLTVLMREAPPDSKSQ